MDDISDLLLPFLAITVTIILAIYFQKKKELMGKYFNTTIDYFAVRYDATPGNNFVVTAEPESPQRAIPPPFKRPSNSPITKEVRPPEFKKNNSQTKNH
jgi:hypothetical protein